MHGQCALGSLSCNPVFSPRPSCCGLCLPWELWWSLWGLASPSLPVRPLVSQSPCEASEKMTAFQAPPGDSGLCFSSTGGLSPHPSHLPTYIHFFFFFLSSKLAQLVFVVSEKCHWISQYEGLAQIMGNSVNYRWKGGRRVAPMCCWFPLGLSVW